MSFSSDYGGVNILVTGEFVAPREWLIRATVQRRSVAQPACRETTRQRALRDLWQGIALESREGRRLGARAVRVFVEGDQDIAGLFIARRIPKESAPPILVRSPSPEEAGLLRGSTVATNGAAQGAASGAV